MRARTKYGVVAGILLSLCSIGLRFALHFASQYSLEHTGPKMEAPPRSDEEAIRRELEKGLPGTWPAAAPDAGAPQADAAKERPLSDGVRTDVGLQVAQGLRQEDEIVSELCDQERGCSGDLEEELAALVRRAIERNVRAARRWPAVTDCDRLARAYRSLRKRGLAVVEGVDPDWDQAMLMDAEEAERRSAGEVRGWVFQANALELLRDAYRTTDSEADLEPTGQLQPLLVPIWYGVYGKDPTGRRIAALLPVIRAELRHAGLEVVDDRPGLRPNPKGERSMFATLLQPRTDPDDLIAMPESPVWVRVAWHRRRPPVVASDEGLRNPRFVMLGMGQSITAPDPARKEGPSPAPQRGAKRAP